MPFVKKTDEKTFQPPPDAQNIFIGRTNELCFFVQHILQPEDPTHNIVSISGHGGVGKSTLLSRFIDEARTPPFKDYCLAALVDERQSTPASMMEKFADQLRMTGAYRQLLKEAGRLEIPVGDLTRAFVEELNHLAETQVTLSSDQTQRQRRIILFFDTFEQLAAQAAPWLLDHVLPADISANVVLVVAGRDPIERSTLENPKRWLPYRDAGTIYLIDLEGFTEDETRTYLAERGITDPERVATIWRLAGGLPLYLSLLTFNPQEHVDPTADVVANFLQWIPEQQHVKRRLALDAALFSRPFNQDDLAAFTYLPEDEDERMALYRWLIRLPFVQSRPQDGRHSYHDLVQGLFRRHLYQHSQKTYYATRRRLADHYRQLLEQALGEGGKEVYDSDEWLELALALVKQLFLLPDEASHIQAIEQVLHASAHTGQTGAIVGVLRELLQEQSNNQVSRSAHQTVWQLLHYLEADLASRPRDFLTVASYLIEKVSHTPTFSSNLLAGIRCKRGSTYRDIQDYRRAIEDFDRALELDSENAWAYVERARSCRRLKDYERALADYHRAHELDSELVWIYELAWAYVERGIAYGELKDYERAIADYNRALELGPKDGWTYFERGMAYLWLKDIRQARSDFTHSWEIDPTNIRTGWMVEWSGMCQGGPDAELAERLEELAAVDPADAVAHVCWGVALGLRGFFVQALAKLEQAISLAPQEWDAYFWKGMVCAALRQDREARAALEQVLALELPPVLLTPLRWLAQERPDFYEQDVLPLLTRY